MSIRSSQYGCKQDKPEGRTEYILLRVVQLLPRLQGTFLSSFCTQMVSVKVSTEWKRVLNLCYRSQSSSKDENTKLLGCMRQTISGGNVIIVHDVNMPEVKWNTGGWTEIGRRIKNTSTGLQEYCTSNCPPGHHMNRQFGAKYCRGYSSVWEDGSQDHCNPRL